MNVKARTAPTKTWFDSRSCVDYLARQAAERGMMLVFSGIPATSNGHGRRTATYALVPHAESLVYMSRPPRTIAEKGAACQKCFGMPHRVTGYACKCGLVRKDLT